MPWPLVPLHAVLLPDGRVLTYGTKPDGTQTGYFNYDLWKPSEGPKGFHLTLPNKTKRTSSAAHSWSCRRATTCSCSAATIGQGKATTNTGNNNSVILRRSDGGAQPGCQDYAAALVCDRDHVAQRRDLHPGWQERNRAAGDPQPGDRRVPRVEGVDTSRLGWWYPRNFVAPNGLIFGVSDQTMYFVDPKGAGKLRL